LPLGERKENAALNVVARKKKEKHRLFKAGDPTGILRKENGNAKRVGRVGGVGKIGGEARRGLKEKKVLLRLSPSDPDHPLKGAS